MTYFQYAVSGHIYIKRNICPLSRNPLKVIRKNKKMTCFSPNHIWIRNSKPIDFQQWTENQQKQHNKVSFTPKREKNGWIHKEIPCGHCIGCRLDKADMWATRVMLEAKNWKNNCFITLTYNNKNLPYKGKHPTLLKKDIQDFMKRLRFHEKGAEEWINPKTGKKEKPIRYFVCGEYGPKGGRPHYHIAIFNWKPKDMKFYKWSKANETIPMYSSKTLYNPKEDKGIWGKGFAVIGELTHNSASYIARYVQKKAGIPKQSRIWIRDDKNQTKHLYKNPNKIEEEFIQMSTGVGLGRKWWEENKEFCKKWGHIDIKINDKVKFKPLPRYFKKLWEKEDWESYEYQKYENVKKAIIQKQQILEQENYDNVINDEVKWNIHLKKQKQILTEKAKILKRDNFT